MEVTDMRAEKFDSAEWKDAVRPSAQITPDPDDPSINKNTHHHLNPNYTTVIKQLDVLFSNNTPAKVAAFNTMVALYKHIELLEYDYEPTAWDKVYIPDVRLFKHRTGVLDYIYNTLVQ